MNVPEFAGTVANAAIEYRKRMEKAGEEFREIVESAVFDLTGRDLASFIAEEVSEPRATIAEGIKSRY